MDWSNERYVRLYTRDTENWDLLSWQARATWVLLLRKLDRAGLLETKFGARGVARATGLPMEVIAVGLAELVADGSLVEHPRGYLAPNFVDAQDTAQSDPQRSRESRARRRDQAKLASVTNRDSTDTERADTVTERVASVTPGHAASRPVTLASLPADPATPAEPSETLPARAIPRSQPPEHVRMRGDAWQYAAQGYTALQLEGIESHEPAFPAMAVGAAKDEFLARCDEVLHDATAGDHAAALALIKRRVDFALAECRRDRTVRWAAPSLLWQKGQFWKGTERSPESAARPRNGAPIRPDDRPPPEDL